MRGGGGSRGLELRTTFWGTLEHTINIRQLNPDIMQIRLKKKNKFARDQLSQ